MEIQDIKNVAGVAYIQTRLRQLGNPEQINNVFNKVGIDGMLGINTTNALEALAALAFGQKPQINWDCEFNYLRGMWNLQRWYKEFYYEREDHFPVSFEVDNLPEPEQDGKWGKNTKACFDRFFELAEFYSRSNRQDGGTLTPVKESAFHSYSVVNQDDPKWADETDTLLRSALSLTQDKLVSISLLNPYNVVILARDVYEGKPRGVLVARKSTGNCSVTKFVQDELVITGLHVNPDLSWDPVAEGLVSELLRVVGYSRVANISHSQTFHRGPESKKVEELLLNKFSFHKKENGTVALRGY